MGTKAPQPAPNRPQQVRESRKGPAPVTKGRNDRPQGNRPTPPPPPPPKK